jgi:hypothetical protein
MKATVAPIPAKAERIPTAKNPIGEPPLSLSAVPSTTTSLDLVSTSLSSSLDSVEAEGDGEEVTLGEDDADGVDADGVDADGVDADGVDADGVDADGVDADGVDADGVVVDGVVVDGVVGVNVRASSRLKFHPSPEPLPSAFDSL